MTRYIAFLRAINVGNRRVKMAQLREPFVALGFDNVATFINSGNVIFDTASRAKPDALEQKIEKQLEGALGFVSETFLRSAEDVAAAARFDAFPGQSAESPAALYIAFLRAAPASEVVERILNLRNTIDNFATHGREVYWLRRNTDSKFSNAAFERAIKQPATFRNVTTMSKIAQAYPPS
jgi:uncharacterized protein (DUF1697 family)